MDKRTLLKHTQLFVLDMDGTFYLGERVLDGALDFLEWVKRAGKQFVFFTNNSSKSPELYIEKLRRMGCEIKKDQLMTSGDVTIGYLQQYYGGKEVYLVGTPALEESFHRAGIILTEEKPAVVVVGFDMSLTYDKLMKACTYIRMGAVFLATHLDKNCPTEEGFIPDCGSICELITASTGVRPKYLGKPFSETMEYVLKQTGFLRSQVAFVGDRLYTDVAAGVDNQALGILVLTGEATLSEVGNSRIQPDGIFESLGEMGNYV